MMKFGYDGRAFSGYQTQPNKRTVQSEIEVILEILFQESVRISASGRTDTGVHALAQVASFETKTTIEPGALTRALSRMLPKDIMLVDVCENSKAIHPRFDSIGKHYRYLCATEDRLFERPYVYFLREDVDIEEMREAAKQLIGVHDFSSFSNRRRGEGDRRRDLWSIEINKKNDKILFDLYGDGFLYRMVRIIVQYLLYVGYGKYSPENTGEILSSRTRTKTRLLAPPEGLYLMNVYYADDPFQKG